ELPIYTRPGQRAAPISVAVGYGRSKVGKAGDGAGANAFPLAPVVRGARRMYASGVTVTPTGRKNKLAEAQRHFSMEGRPIVLETTREELSKAEHKEELPNLW